MMNEEQKKPVSRGGCLTAFLIVSIIANTLATLSYVFMGPMIRQTMPNIPSWGLYAFALVGVLNIICAAGIWKFKRWGVYGTSAFSLLVFITNIIFGIPIISAVLGLVGIGIIIILVRPLWSEFK